MKGYLSVTASAPPHVRLQHSAFLSRRRALGSRLFALRHVSRAGRVVHAGRGRGESQ